MCGGAAVDWGSHTQSVVATSTCEAEVLATVRGTQQLIHIKTLLEEFDIASPLEPTLSFEDNKAARIILGTPGRVRAQNTTSEPCIRCISFPKMATSNLSIVELVIN